MNEQLTELDKAAQEYAGKIAGNDEDSNYAEWFNVYKEQFAKLLIKDLARAAVIAADAAETKMMSTRIIETWLKKQYGVEQ
jgi:hypothetical protein